MATFTFASLRPLLSAITLSSLAALPFAGCGGTEMVPASSSIYDRAVKALTGPSGPITPKGVKGSYGPACKVHKNEAWSLLFGAPVTTPPGLEVALNETFANCPLTMTHVSVQSGSSGPLVDYALATPIGLSLNYVASATAVNLPPPGGTQPAFYTNARLTGLPGTSYSNSFVIDVLYSDDKQACDLNAPPATYATVNAVATGSAIPPPNYTINWDGLALKVDANKIVQGSSSGSVILKFASQAGEEWKLFGAPAPDCCGANSFGEIDTYYRNTTALASGTITGNADVPITWDKFGLLGVDLTLKKYRYVIVKHVGAGSVVSYELLQIAFTGPA